MIRALARLWRRTHRHHCPTCGQRPGYFDRINHPRDCSEATP